MLAFRAFVLFGGPSELLCSTLRMFVLMSRGLLKHFQSFEYICDPFLIYNSPRTKSPLIGASTTLQSGGPAETSKQKIEENVAIKEISIRLTEEHVIHSVGLNTITLSMPARGPW